MMFHGKGQGGFIKAIIVIVIALIILGYFGYNIEDIVNSPTVKNNLSYVWGLVTFVWDKYLEIPATFVWEKIIIGLGWDNLIKLIDWVKGAEV